MPDPSGNDAVTVVVSDEQSEVEVDGTRWKALASSSLRSLGAAGELTLTFVDRDEIATLNREHMGVDGPTDVLSFPLDDVAEPHGEGDGIPVLLGDVVVCPGVAADGAASHAGTVDDELALLVVHGVLHVLGRDHVELAESEQMRAEELTLLVEHHWGGPPPPGFRQDHDAG